MSPFRLRMERLYHNYPIFARRMNHFKNVNGQKNSNLELYRKIPGYPPLFIEFMDREIHIIFSGLRIGEIVHRAGQGEIVFTHVFQHLRK